MPFTVQDFHDLVRLLEEHPDWREELRRLVLTQDLVDLPQVVRENSEFIRRLAEAQKQTEVRIDTLVSRIEELAQAQARTEAQVAQLAQAQARTEAQVAQLAEAQKRTEARLDALAARVEELAQAQARTEARLAQLADAQRRTEQRLDAFEQRTEERFQRIDADLKDLKDSVSVLKGHDLERTYRDRAAGYFGRLFKGLRVLPDYEVDRLLEAAVTQGIITWEERDDVLESDLVARGQLRSTNQTAFLVVEISWGVGPEDVERAHRRAATLQKVTGAAIAAVAGVSILPKAKELSDTLGVTRVTDGSVEGPGIIG